MTVGKKRILAIRVMPFCLFYMLAKANDLAYQQQ
jgi:hypothetical protein